MRSQFITTEQVTTSLKEEAQVFMMLASLKVEGEPKVTDQPMVCEFLDMFSDDISDLPLEIGRVCYWLGTWY